MTERSIIFSGPAVRAILDGRQAQTRRVVKPQYSGAAVLLKCPYGVPGDRLWVRESHYRFTGCAPAWEGFIASPDGDPYKARCYDDYPNLPGALNACAVVRVRSAHMPRWASRITLEITDVRVQRVQEISEADAYVEGCELGDDPVCCGNPVTGAEYMGQREEVCCGRPEHDKTYRAGFRDLWDSINAKRAPWASNPWVWAITFKRTRP